LIDYFALGFGVMVGTAWLVVMDDILQRGGPLGAVLGFTTGALMLLPIGYVYGQTGPSHSRRGWRSRLRRPLLSPQCELRDWLDDVPELFFDLSIRSIGRGPISGYLFPSLNRSSCIAWADIPCICRTCCSGSPSQSC